MKFASKRICLLVCVGLGAACDGDVIQPDPQTALVVSPDSLLFAAPLHGAAATAVLKLQSTSGSAVAWELRHVPAGLSASLSSGHTPARITITARPDFFGAGSHRDSLVLAAEGADPGTVTVPVRVSVSDLLVQTSALAFVAATGGVQPPEQSVELRPLGADTVEWRALVDVPWLQLPDSSGPAPGSLTVRVDVSMLTAGTYQDTVYIYAAGATSPSAQIPVRVDVLPLQLQPEVLAFTVITDRVVPDTQNVQIANDGGASIEWRLRHHAGWLLPLDSAGSVPAGGVVSIPVTFDLRRLQVGTYVDTLRVIDGASGAELFRIPVQLRVGSLQLPHQILSRGLVFTLLGGGLPPAEVFPIIGTVPWQARADAAWIQLHDTAGPPPSHLAVSVAAPPQPELIDSITIWTAGIEANPYRVPVNVAQAVPPQRGAITLSTGGAFLTIDPEGTRLRRFLTSAWVLTRGSWSPDGEWFLFTKSEGPGPQTYPQNLYKMRWDGSGYTRLTSGNAGQSYIGTWTAGGSRIIVELAGGGSQWYIMEADGSGMVPYDKPPCINFSPDGSRAVCVNDVGIYMINADGSGFRQLTEESGGVDRLGRLSWAPEGRRIAFGRALEPRDSRTTEIFVLDVESGATARLTDSPGFDGSPAWSPDGGSIAFMSARASTPWDPSPQSCVFVMRADGSDQRRLGDSCISSSPSWRP